MQLRLSKQHVIRLVTSAAQLHYFGNLLLLRELCVHSFSSISSVRGCGASVLALDLGSFNCFRLLLCQGLQSVMGAFFLTNDVWLKLIDLLKVLVP
jgi:hypothetical protein